ncbi:hypothetical protein BDV95DRAFT_482811 [Massariosphaeria phaeospora]|uniref:Short-chain dehydrogenase n=1 Tax=Massariosphaeria phaeospora TaxID=100035 RepID=A0A7C8INK3_9PLEO|nr:hypothetical protein BDV95DRAFT_482811 [Massariosphaeria phaeospora]
MPSTTHAEFNDKTEALDVAKAFADGIRGKTILVTGANKDGLGFSTLQAFASQAPAHLVLAGRNLAKVQECIDALKADYPNVDYRALKLDLSSQKTVRAAASEILAWSDIVAIDIVVNSAGVMGIPERTLNEDGIEMHFGTNHIGHWLFSNLIMPKLITAASKNPKGATRIINVSSMSPLAAGIRWSDINFDKKNKDLPEIERPNKEWMTMWGYTDTNEASYIPLEGYNQSKVANVHFSVGVNTKLYEKYGIASLALHPGVIPTELGRNFPEKQLEAIKKMPITYKTLGAGSSTTLVAALDPKLGEGVGETRNESQYGAFLLDCQITEVPARAGSSKEAERLWELSEELVKETFRW